MGTYKIAVIKVDKKSKNNIQADSSAASSSHLDNLIALRKSNPQAYERLGESTRQSVERYELEQVASTFEYREGMERMLDLKERLPKVFDNFSEEMKRRVEEYAEKKRAYQTVMKDAER